MGGIEEHHRAARLENAEMGGHDLPVVLLHGHGHDLVRAGEEGRQRSGDGVGSRVELGEGQAFSSVGYLQGRVVREFHGGAAEDIGQPPRSSLMWSIHEVAVSENIPQAVLAGVHLSISRLFGDPEVPSPRDEGCYDEDHEGGCRNRDHHVSVSDCWIL